MSRGDVSSGPGWGGPKKGVGSGGEARAFTADSETRVLGAQLDNSDPGEQAYRQSQKAKVRSRREAAWKALDDLVADKKHPSHFLASKETLNRVEGVPVQKTEITGSDGGSLKIETIRRVIVDPKLDNGDLS